MRIILVRILFPVLTTTMLLFSMLATPAAAGPSVGDVICNSGNSEYNCIVMYADESDTVTWDVYYDGYVYLHTLYGTSIFEGCVAGHWYWFSVWISDETGSTWRSGSVTCDSGWWD